MAEKGPGKRVNTTMCPHVGSRGLHSRRGGARWPHAVSVAVSCGATSSSSTSSATPALRAVTVGAGSVAKAWWPHVGAAPQGSRRMRSPLWRPRDQPCGAWHRPSSTTSPSSSATRSWALPGLASNPLHHERHHVGPQGPATRE